MCKDWFAIIKMLNLTAMIFRFFASPDFGVGMKIVCFICDEIYYHWSFLSVENNRTNQSELKQNSCESNRKVLRISSMLCWIFWINFRGMRNEVLKEKLRLVFLFFAEHFWTFHIDCSIVITIDTSIIFQNALHNTLIVFSFKKPEFLENRQEKTSWA